jgi:hypothetical protein
MGLSTQVFKYSNQGCQTKQMGKPPPSSPPFLSTILNTCINEKQLPIIFRVRYSVIASQILSYCLSKQIGKILEILFSNIDCTNFANCLDKLANSFMKNKPFSGTVRYFVIMCLQCNFYCRRKVAELGL